jgi:hypothetical protein
MCDVAGDRPHAGIDLRTIERVASTAGSDSRQHGQGVQEPEDSQILHKVHCLQICEYLCVHALAMVLDCILRSRLLIVFIASFLKNSLKAESFGCI